MKKKLTNKQQMFVNEYIVDFNATRAAKAAGYSEKTARKIGSQNLTKLDIQIAVQKAIKAREARVQRTADDVLDLLWSAAEVDPIEYCTVEEGGEIRMKPLDQIRPEVRRLISKIKQKREITESADGSIILCEDDLELGLPSKEKMIELLMKHHGLLTPEKEGGDDIPEDTLMAKGYVNFNQIMKDIADAHMPGQLWNHNDMPPKQITGTGDES